MLVCTAAIPFAAGAQRLSGEALVEALRNGGYTIYFRHAATDWSLEDRVATEGDWSSCDPHRMRQLSEQGRNTADRTGAAMRRLGIPVGRVYASEYCRARHTAEHLNLGPVTVTQDVMNLRVAEYLGGREAMVDRARRALAESPPAGRNTVFVAHGNLMRAVTGAYTGEAGSVILKPRGDKTSDLVAVLEPGDWQRLADRFASPSKPPD